MYKAYSQKKIFYVKIVNKPNLNVYKFLFLTRLVNFVLDYYFPKYRIQPIMSPHQDTKKNKLRARH